MDQAYHKLTAGFTLAEVLVVIAIIGIAAAIVIPMISDTSDMEATAAARQIVSTLLFAQTAAISTQQQYQVVFNPDTNSYEVQDKDGTVIPDPVVVDAPYRVNYSSNPHLRTVTIESANFDGANTVWFDRLGAPYSGPISDNTPLQAGNVTVRAGDRNLVVNVAPVTGRVKVNE